MNLIDRWIFSSPTFGTKGWVATVVAGIFLGVLGAFPDMPFWALVIWGFGFVAIPVELWRSDAIERRKAGA